MPRLSRPTFCHRLGRRHAPAATDRATQARRVWTQANNTYNLRTVSFSLYQALYIYLHIIPINIFPLIMSVRLGMRCNAIFFYPLFFSSQIILAETRPRDLCGGDLGTYFPSDPVPDTLLFRSRSNLCQNVLSLHTFYSVFTVYTRLDTLRCAVARGCGLCAAAGSVL